MSLQKKSLTLSASKKIYYLFIGFVLVIPLFFDVGVSGIHLGRNIFEAKRAGTFTVPVSVFIVGIMVVPVFLRAPFKLVRFKLGKEYQQLIGAYALWCTMLAVYSAAFFSNLESILYLIQVLLPLSMFIFCSQAVQRPGALVYLIKGMFYGLVGTILFHLSYAFAEVGFPDVFFQRILTKAWGINIYQTYSYYPIGLIVVFALLSGIYFVYEKKHTKFVEARGLFPVFLVLVVLLSLLACRDAFIGLFFVLLTQVIAFKKLKNVYVVFGALLSLVIIVGYVQFRDHNIPIILRIDRALQFEESKLYTGGRSTFISMSLSVIFQNPIIGTALRHPSSVYPELFRATSAHNTYIDTLMWTGIPGLFLIVSILIKSLKDAFFLSKRFRDTVWKGVAIGAFSTSVMITFISNNARVPMRQPYSGMLIWSIIGMIAGMKEVYKNQLLRRQ